MKKVIVIICIMMFASIYDLVFSYAAVEKNCLITTDWIEVGIIPDENEILKEPELRTAINNLQKYCKRKSGDQLETPVSGYLMDHLIDIGFRKLFGDSDNLYGLNPDPDAQERRDAVREKAEDSKGKTPQELLKLFSEKRKISSDQGLYHKYKAVCNEARQIMSRVHKEGEESSTPDVLLGPKSLDDESSVESGKAKCEELATAETYKEMSYVRSLMLHKGIKLLKDNLRDYLIDYFSRNRLDKLLEKFTFFQGMFSEVSQRINEGAENCDG